MDNESERSVNGKGRNKNNEEFQNVNLSNNGLTMIPVTLFKRTEVTHLNVSENNIKSLPVDIGKLINLKHLNISRNGFQCTSSEDLTILPIIMKNLKKLQYLNISECNLAFLPATIWELISLEQLDISRNNIEELRPGIGNLDQLKLLNAQHCGLTTLPQEIVGCEKLETLLLYGNVIQTLPYLLADITNLKHLSINLRHIGEKIDSNMDSLLQSGQILSDHICNTIFNLPSVQKIELEFCKLNYFKHFQSRELQELYIRGNYFKDISETILNLSKLEILDLSKNLLTKISDGIVKLENVTILHLQENLIENLSSKIFEMKSLKILDVSHNKIKKLNIPLDYLNKCLISLTISHNKIKSIPNHINNLENLQDFDITNNKITEIPLDLCLMNNIKVAHSFDGLHKIGLWLLNNPIEFPPKNVWNTTDIGHLFLFLKKTKIEKLKKKTPIRVLLFGENNLQKNIFLQKFLCQPQSDQLEYLTINRWTSPNCLPFVFVNINCMKIYSMHFRHYIDYNSLIWLFINRNTTEEQIEKWINLIIDYSTDCVIQIIIFDHLLESNEEAFPLQKDINVNNKAMNFELIKNLKEKYQNEKLIILTDILEISVNNSFHPFIDKLEYIAIDQNLFQEDNTFNIFINESKSIEKICKSSPCIYINLNDVVSKIKEILSMTTESIHSCLKILHKQGKILWFSNNKKLNEKIYPFISLFNKSIYCISRVNYEEMDFLRNPLIKSDGLMNETIFEDVKRNFLCFGEISYPLYKVLTFEMKKSLIIKDFLVDSNIVWVAPISVNLEEDIFQRPYVVVPQFNKELFDKNYLFEIILKKESVKIEYCFSIRSSSICDQNHLFLNLRCAINCWAIRRFDWLDFVYLYHDDGDIFLHNEFSSDLQTNFNIIVRSWSKRDFDRLPCNGNFKQWLNDWYACESANRNKFSYNITDLNVIDINEYILNL